MNDPFGGTSQISQLAPRGLPMMTSGNLSVQIHMPVATRSQYAGREEAVSRLAPAAPKYVYRVDDFLGCPPEWARSDASRGVASYFTVAQPGCMVWFDLRPCEQHEHHVAAVFSAQGICAVTGQRMTPPPRLQQHPEQNYIATTSVHPGRFWRDGFKAADGKTREFLFTEDAARGVAASVIGDDRVNAFGVALFLSREPKPRPRYDAPMYRGGGFAGPQFSMNSGGVSRSVTRGASRGPESMEVAAGALVNQDVERDSRRLDFWQTEPSAVFLLYYVSEQEFNAIASAGQVPRSEGWIKTPVGH